MRRSCRMSFFLLGFGARNKDVSLYTVVSFRIGGTGILLAYAVRTYPVPPFGDFGFRGPAELSADFGLQVGDQAGSVFTGELLEGVNFKRTAHALNVLFRVLGLLGESIQGSHLCGCGLPDAATLRF